MGRVLVMPAKPGASFIELSNIALKNAQTLGVHPSEALSCVVDMFKARTNNHSRAKANLLNAAKKLDW